MRLREFREVEVGVPLRNLGRVESYFEIFREWNVVPARLRRYVQADRIGGRCGPRDINPKRAR